MQPEKPYFRVGVGAVLYNNKNEILCFARTDQPTIWQFPQGGVDKNEDYEQTLWRELFEETAITKSMISDVTEYPEWTMYEYPPIQREETKHVVGQAHRWYFLKIKSDCQPNLDEAIDKEFCTWQTLTMTDFLNIPTHDFKLNTYHSLADFFATHIIKKSLL